MAKEDTVVENVRLPRALVTRLRLIQQAMEERLGRPFSMDEMYRHIIDEFLETLASK